MLIEYVPDQTFLHSLDVRTKLGCFIGLIIISFLFNAPLLNLILFFTVGTKAIYVRMPMKKIYHLCRSLFPVCIMIVLITGCTYISNRFHSSENRAVLFYIIPSNSIGMSVGGLKMGITFVIRLFTMVIASSILTLTTPIDDFVRLSNKLKMPSEISFVITTALRFLPTMDKKRQLIIEAQRARGAQLDKKGLINRVKSYLPILIPMFTNSIVISNTLAMGMLNRGYNSTCHMSYSEDLSFQTIDYIIIIFLVMILMSSFYIRFVLKYGIL